MYIHIYMYINCQLSQDSQEVLYLKALALLLRSGLTTASEAITYTFPLRTLGNGSDMELKHLYMYL
jgi:hypothetical protein